MSRLYEIPGQEGRYLITKQGKVWSNITSRFLKSWSDKGYTRVKLTKGKSFYVHKLVMLTFRGVSDLEVNHIDGNKENNNLSNLEYCTRKQNVHHAYRTGLFKVKMLTDKEIEILKCLHAFEYTQRDMAKIIGTSQRTVGRHIKRLGL